ncbi:MAG: hypothetical protein ACREAD_02990 [Nitrosopumilaceae archaeon]
MKVGAYDVPEQRLIPTVVTTLEEIYKVKKRDRIQSKDLAILLGFKYGTEPHYYRKIHALQEYGLMEGKGLFQISELGEKVLHPRDDNEKALVMTKAVLNVPLWKEIYQKHGKKPRDDNFWAVLVDITKVDPATAKSNTTKILGWYEADIGHITEDLVGKDIGTGVENIETKGLSSKDSNIRTVSQQLVTPTDPDSFGILSVKGIGNIDLTDDDSITLAESALKILRKKLPTMKSKSSSTAQPTE